LSYKPFSETRRSLPVTQDDTSYTDELREMYALYERGSTLKEVGEKFGYSERAMSARFRRAGLATREKIGRGSQTRPRRHWENGYPVDEMYAAYREGASLRQVGERFGVSKPVLSRLFKAAGLQIRPTRPADADRRIAAMYELYQRGASMREVAQEFGISNARVSKLFEQAGLQARGRGRRSKARMGGSAT
jgi:transposase